MFGKKIFAHKNSSTNTGGGLDSKQQLEIIFNSIEDGLILIDAMGNISLFNPGAGVITGWEVKDAIGVNINTVIKLLNEKGQSYVEADNPFSKAFKSEQTVKDSRAKLVNRSNNQISISIIASPLKDNLGKVVSIVAIIRNVEDEKQEEQRLADFISTASHEMRTPVAAIEGYLSLALNPKVTTIDNRAKDYLEKAHSATQHLGELFQDLLTSAKADDGRLTSNPAVLETGEFLSRLSEDLRFSAEKKGLETEYIIGGTSKVIKATQGDKEVTPLYYVFVDPDRIREVITNLFDNAVKYTPAGKISIGLTGDNDVVQLYIKDTGPGIDNPDIAHLFQKFYRVDNSATRTIGGTGLGLYICRKIIELYNGRIWVESEVGKGSTFYINLPRLSSERARQLTNDTSDPNLVTPSGGTATS